MELETQADVEVQSATDESESGDDDGPRIGQGAWVNGRWEDPLDPHPAPQRERRSMEALDPDYEPEQQVMKTRWNYNEAIPYIFIDYALGLDKS